ncbi:hypothetical protein BpHYR1_021672 [Brachionus plicatilis]|uniref:Uncharacterized protein n=1 Tax=Brachionus plicatilis TaxID=10195 RepID=A0A3M7RUW6_BRAPC|nr:hypothetical protein BpHYR1_021672 [Brachionus plicatilis]
MSQRCRIKVQVRDGLQVRLGNFATLKAIHLHYTENFSIKKDYSLSKHLSKSFKKLYAPFD